MTNPVHEQTSTPDPMMFALRPTRPPIGDGVVVFAVVALTPIFMALAAAVAYRCGLGVFGPQQLQIVAALAALAVLVGVVGSAVVGLRRRRRRFVRAPALLEHDAFTMTPAGQGAPVRIAFADIRVFQRSAGRAQFVIGTDAVQFSVGPDDFVDDFVSTEIEARISHALASSPDGAVHVEELKQQAALTSSVTQRTAVATNALLAVVAVLFTAELLTGALSDVGQLLALGANAPSLVKQGQLWRLVTAGFLHGSVSHILMNAAALLSFGAILERLIGRHRFVLIAIVASIGGNVASAVGGTSVMSVGASSCIWGLMGALLVVQYGARTQMPHVLVIPKRRWAYILGLNGLISLLPGIDLLAHVGGFFSGAGLALVFLRGLDVRSPQASRRLVMAVIVVVVVTVACFAFVLGRAARFTHDERLNDVLDLASPAIVNSAAWAIVQGGTADPALLAHAERSQRIALEQVESAHTASVESYRDTLAWLRFRQGAVDDAIALERVALTREPTNTLATSLARFLRTAAPAPIAGVTVTPSTIDAGASTQPRVLYVEFVDIANLGLWRVLLPPSDGPIEIARPVGVPATAGPVPRLLSSSGPELGATETSTWFQSHSTTAALP